MNRAVPLLVGLSVLATGIVAEAKTYRWVNDQGVVVYSDQPPQVRLGDKERDALIAEALEISGTKKEIESIPAQIRAQFDARQTPVRPEDKTRVIRILTDAFRPDVLYSAVRNAFRSNFDAQRMEAVMELAAGEPGARQDLERFAMGLQGDIPAPARVALVQRQEAVMRSAELQIDLAIIGAQAVGRSLDPVLSPTQRATGREMDAAVSKLRSQQDALTRAALVRWLYTYRALTTEELAQYVEFNESDAGRWFAATQRKGLIEAMRAAMDTAARHIASAFPAKR